MSKKEVDWEAVARDYRPNIMSLREIGAKHGCSETAIRKWAKREGIERDLGGKVREEIRNRLVRTSSQPEAKTTRMRTEREIVEEAAVTGTEVVLAHRRTIRNGFGAAMVLMEQFVTSIREREVIEEEIIDDTPAREDRNRRQKMLAAVSLPSHAGVLKDLTASMANLIKMEREAYGIDEDSGKEKLVDPLSALLQEIDGKTAGLPERQALAFDQQPSENPDPNRITTQS